MRPDLDLPRLALDIKRWGRELGFQKLGIADVELHDDEVRLLEWLRQGRHGEMHYMAAHGTKRSRPAELVAGTIRVISARMDYWPRNTLDAHTVLDDGELGYVARYALGRDYHKVIRARLNRLAERVSDTAGPFGYRAFVDSAPVLEKPLARLAGIGWVGKHTNVLSREAGSWFFLGELYTDLPLPVDEPVSAHCGSCSACIQSCPTGAIVAPFQLDARLCISYLTIELKGSIPVALRPQIGNRVFGCDDCQLVCPWNRYATPSAESDFSPRHGLDSSTLTELFAWSESQFDVKTRGSAIRRIGHIRWLRNIAVALGNANTSPVVLTALRSRATHESELVREHVAWALARHGVNG